MTVILIICHTTFHQDFDTYNKYSVILLVCVNDPSVSPPVHTTVPRLEPGPDYFFYAQVNFWAWVQSTQSHNIGTNSLLDRASFPSDAGTEIAQCKTLANTNRNLTATFCSIFKYWKLICEEYPRGGGGGGGGGYSLYFSYTYVPPECPSF